ncbi:hypothetical protein ACL2XN_26445 [Sodalis sp. RH22]|uniref:hypothetical protein n=1 Tax=Sodalis sp. RH22 TaxID=3394337 RepID=UPI0039B625C7
MKPLKISIIFGKNNKYRFNAHSSFIIWLILLMLFPVLAIVKEDILPKYFFWDANTIYAFMKSGSDFAHGDSFSSTAAFYNLFSVDRYSFIFPLISSLIIVYLFVIALKRSMAKEITLLEVGMYLFYLMLSVIYMTLLSKDFIVLLVIAPFLFLAKKGIKGLLLWSILAMAYGYFYRSYWFIFVCQFWMMYMAFGIVKKPWQVVCVVLVFLLLLAIAFHVGLGVDIDRFRTIINDMRIETQDANAKTNTMITSYIPGGGDNYQLA